MKRSAGGGLKIAKFKTFSIPIWEGIKIQGNGWYHWIQGIEYVYLPYRRTFRLYIKAAAGGCLKAAKFYMFLITVKEWTEIQTNGWYHWIKGIKYDWK